MIHKSSKVSIPQVNLGEPTGVKHSTHSMAPTVIQKTMFRYAN